MTWWRRALLGLLPPRVTGGTPIPATGYRCPSRCGFTDRDPEVVFAHAFTHPGRDRRRTARSVAA